MDATPGRIVQLAYAVDDVHAAARRFERDLGAGPFVVSEHIAIEPDRDDVLFDHSSAYGQWGNLQVELVHVHSAQPASLARAVMRTSGLHHVAWFVETFDTEQRRLHDRGWPCVLSARAGDVRFAFHDARAELGHLVEIYEPSSRLLAFYDHVASLAGSDG
jgi:hypothetical protein